MRLVLHYPREEYHTRLSYSLHSMEEFVCLFFFLLFSLVCLFLFVLFFTFLFVCCFLFWFAVGGFYKLFMELFNSGWYVRLCLDFLLRTIYNS